MSSSRVDPVAPAVTFRGHRIDCERGALLCDVLLAAGESPHNGATSAS